MGRKLPFFPMCGSPTRTLSFRATTMVAGEEDPPPVESVIRGLTSDRFFFKPGNTNSILEEAKAKDKDEHQEEFPFKESVSTMEIDSTDPFLDFKNSMQEMVEADEGLKEWENLQELLSWYLEVNDKTNHGYIVGAFIDLLIMVNLGRSSSLSSNGQDQSLLTESSISSISDSSSSNDKQKTVITSESPESGLSFTSSSACSSSHCLSSSSSMEDEGDEDHNSAQKADDSSLKV